MEIEGKRILIISPERYGEVFLSKHHYAKHLSRCNKVWFLNAKGVRNQRKIVSINAIEENLNTIDYLNLYYGFGKIPLWMTSLINRFISGSIRREIGQIDIVWSFEQAKFFNLDLFKAKVKIFHPVDYVDQFHNEKLKIANSSDFIFSVSEEILNTIPTNTRKVLINHGVNIGVKNEVVAEENKFKSDKIKLAYIGNINTPFLDIENLVNAVDHNPDKEFHFFGPYDNSNLGRIKSDRNYKELDRRDNTTFHGVIEQGKIVTVLAHFDILISCYNYSKFPVRLSNSHKILEYLLSGRMVISNYFPIYKHLDNDLVILLKDNTQLAEEIQKVAARIDHYNIVGKQMKRKAIALDNTYEEQLKRINNIIQNSVSVTS